MRRAPNSRSGLLRSRKSLHSETKDADGGTNSKPTTPTKPPPTKSNPAKKPPIRSLSLEFQPPKSANNTPVKKPKPILKKPSSAFAADSESTIRVETEDTVLPESQKFSNEKVLLLGSQDMLSQSQPSLKLGTKQNDKEEEEQESIGMSEASYVNFTVSEGESLHFHYSPPEIAEPKKTDASVKKQEEKKDVQKKTDKKQEQKATKPKPEVKKPSLEKGLGKREDKPEKAKKVSKQVPPAPKDSESNSLDDFSTLWHTKLKSPDRKRKRNSKDNTRVGPAEWIKAVDQDEKEKGGALESPKKRKTEEDKIVLVAATQSQRPTKDKKKKKEEPGKATKEASVKKSDNKGKTEIQSSSHAVNNQKEEKSKPTAQKKDKVPIQKPTVETSAKKDVQAKTTETTHDTKANEGKQAKEKAPIKVTPKFPERKRESSAKKKGGLAKWISLSDSDSEDEGSSSEKEKGEKQQEPPAYMKPLSSLPSPYIPPTKIAAFLRADSATPVTTLITLSDDEATSQRSQRSQQLVAESEPPVGTNGFPLGKPTTAATSQKGLLSPISLKRRRNSLTRTSHSSKKPKLSLSSSKKTTEKEDTKTTTEKEKGKEKEKPKEENKAKEEKIEAKPKAATSKPSHPEKEGSQERVLPSKKATPEMKKKAAVEPQVSSPSKKNKARPTKTESPEKKSQDILSPTFSSAANSSVVSETELTCPPSVVISNSSDIGNAPTLVEPSQWIDSMDDGPGIVRVETSTLLLSSSDSIDRGSMDALSTLGTDWNEDELLLPGIQEEETKEQAKEKVEQQEPKEKVKEKTNEKEKEKKKEEADAGISPEWMDTDEGTEQKQATKVEQESELTSDSASVLIILEDETPNPPSTKEDKQKGKTYSSSPLMEQKTQMDVKPSSMPDVSPLLEDADSHDPLDPTGDASSSDLGFSSSEEEKEEPEEGDEGENEDMPNGQEHESETRKVLVAASDPFFDDPSMGEEREEKKSKPKTPTKKKTPPRNVKRAKLIWEDEEEEEENEENEEEAEEEEEARDLKSRTSFSVGKGMAWSVKNATTTSKEKPSKKKDKKKKKKEKSGKDAVEDIDSDGDFAVQKFRSKSVKPDESPRRFIFGNPKVAQDEPLGEPLLLSGIEDTPRYQIPASINRKLHDYQRDGVKFLYNLFSQNRGGILGDDMGLGKTVQTIAFLATVMRKSDQIKRSRKSPRSIIVAPASLLEQWKLELQKWGAGCEGGGFRVAVYWGKEKQSVLRDIQSGCSDILLTSYDTFRKDFDQINEIKWTCLIFDEVHKLKDRKSKLTIACMAVNNPRRYGLTGTVMQNSFEELWTLLNWAEPNCLGSLESVRDHFINPIKHGQRHNANRYEVAMGRKAAKELSSRIRKLILRRDKSLIEDQLPKKEDFIVFCPLTPLQIAAYQRVLRSKRYQLMLQSNDLCDCGSLLKRKKCCYAEEGEKAEILKAISKLTNLSNHLMLLAPHPKDKKQKERMDEEFFRLALGEDYDTVKELHETGQDTELCGKFKVLRTLLLRWKSESNKVLLFSRSTRMLDLIESFLRKETMGYCRLDGSTPRKERQDIIERFKKNNRLAVFLISTKAGGLGLNLTVANIVVVFDPNWNASHDLQAQDRAFRLGQTRDTSVFRFVSAGTIEETVYQRQIYKQQLANIGMEGKTERRYFEGVAGVKGQEGELFGIANLLRLNLDSTSTTDIIQRTEMLEKSTDGFVIEKSGLCITGDADASTLKSATAKGDEYTMTSVHDLTEPDVRALLEKSGVKSFLKHDEVLGESEFEKQLYQLASKELETEVQPRSDTGASEQHVTLKSRKRRRSLGESEDLDEEEENETNITALLMQKNSDEEENEELPALSPRQLQILYKKFNEINQQQKGTKSKTGLAPPSVPLAREKTSLHLIRPGSSSTSSSRPRFIPIATNQPTPITTKTKQSPSLQKRVAAPQLTLTLPSSQQSQQQQPAQQQPKKKANTTTTISNKKKDAKPVQDKEREKEKLEQLTKKRNAKAAEPEWEPLSWREYKGEPERDDVTPFDQASPTRLLRRKRKPPPSPPPLDLDDEEDWTEED